MKYLKKAIKFISYTLILALIGLGLGINSAIFPVYTRPEDEEDQIELVEEKDEVN